MSKMTLDLEGFKELNKNLKGLRGIVDSRGVLNDLHDGLKIVKRIAKSKAPSGPTRNLKKAIRTGIFKRQKHGNPAVFMGIDYSIGPHAHLVEYGTKRRTPKKFSVLKFEVDGQTIYVRWARPMPARPFWRPSVAFGKDAAGRMASKKIARRIERTAAKKQLKRYARLI